MCLCYKWRLKVKIATRYQSPDGRTADFLTFLHDLFIKFQRPVTMKEQMDKVHRNVRPDLRRSIRRFEFSDYNQLTLLATQVETKMNLDRGKRSLPSPVDCFFPELAYDKNTRFSRRAGKIPVVPYWVVPTPLSNLWLTRWQNWWVN